MKKILSLSFVFTLFVLGISSIPSHKANAAVTVSVTASPTSVAYLGHSTITWESSGATSCDQVNGTGGVIRSNIGTSSSLGFDSGALGSTTTFYIKCTAPDVVNNHISYQSLVTYGFFLPGHANGIDYNVCVDSPVTKDESFAISYEIGSPYDYPITGSVTAYISSGQTCSPLEFSEAGPQDMSGRYYSTLSFCVAPSNSNITVDSSIRCN